MPSGVPMEEGYYWFQNKDGDNEEWEICKVVKEGFHNMEVVFFDDPEPWTEEDLIEEFSKEFYFHPIKKPGEM